MNNAIKVFAFVKTILSVSPKNIDESTFTSFKTK